MKAVWTSTTPVVAAVTLGDDTAKQTMVIDGLGAGAAEQVVPLFRATNPLRIQRGNVAGELSIIAAKSHASRNAAASYYLGEHGRINQVGNLVITVDTGGTTLTFTGAVLKAVSVAAMDGLRWAVRYQFGFTTMA